MCINWISSNKKNKMDDIKKKEIYKYYFEHLKKKEIKFSKIFTSFKPS